MVGGGVVGDGVGGGDGVVDVGVSWVIHADQRCYHILYTSINASPLGVQCRKQERTCQVNVFYSTAPARGMVRGSTDTNKE